jgi:alkylhydroperoxidase family enzyme
MVAIAEDYTAAQLGPADIAIMAFAEKVVRDASAITGADVQALRDHGLSDGDIFDVAAAAATRCFFSKLRDAVGAEPDSAHT